MPLYRTLCISAHFREYARIKDLITQSATLLLENGAVVRNIENMGTRVLPQRMHANNIWHNHGDYWTLSYDASPELASQLARVLRKDPRVIRWTTRKLAERLPQLSARSITTPGGAPQGRTVLLFPADSSSRTSTSTSTRTSKSEPDAALQDSLLGVIEGLESNPYGDPTDIVPMAPQQRSMYQRARQTLDVGASAGSGSGGLSVRRHFSTDASSSPLSRSQACAETRWLDERTRNSIP